MRSAFLIATSIIAFSVSADFEQVSSLDAAAVTPENLQRGPNHVVETTVSNNGLLNIYGIDSEFGIFTATGTNELRTLIREIDALAYLETMSKTSVFLEALKATGIKSVESVVSVFKSPVKTLKGLPSGVKRLFSGFARSTERGVRATKKVITGDNEIDTTEFRRSNYLLSNNERNWSSELKTDPYSTNVKLRAAVADMSVVQFIGGLPVELALPLGASLTIDIVGEIDGQIYQKTAAELEVDNRNCLEEMGIESEAVEGFIQAPYLTPTLQTVFCSSARGLAGVDNLVEVVEQIGASESFEESRFLLSAVSLLSWYHTSHSPLMSIVADESLPQATTVNNEHLVMLPIDYLFWTESSAATIDRMSKSSNAQRSFWILGQMSDRARKELEARRWEIHDITNSSALKEIYQSAITASS